ncbi:MAG: hypothetical protein HYX72_01895 [Acidobacteria bacterium]|nr:hypothetical protein [Acidobacteriota bacterium]
MSKSAASLLLSMLLYTAQFSISTPSLGATIQDFDTPGTPFVGANYPGPNTAPPPGVLPGGPTGNFLRLKEYTMRTFNAVGFDQTQAGAASRITAEVDFRITCSGTRIGFACADGFSMIFLNTSRYGTNGAPPAFDEAGRLSTGGQTDSFAVGFGVFDPGWAGSWPQNRVWITYNGTIISSFLIDRSVLDLATGTNQTPSIFLHLSVDLTLSGPDPKITVGVSNATTTITAFSNFSLAAVAGLGPYESRLGFGARSGDAGIAVDLDNINVQFQTTAEVSPDCNPNNPAPISGSTGEQGMLDSASWPTGAVSSRVNLDTGVMTFLNSSGAPTGTPVTLPGARTTAPAFPNGLNFLNVHLGAGASLAFTTASTGLQPPVMLLSCQDVVLDAGSTLAAMPFVGPGPVPGSFMGATSTTASVSPAGFGPRAGSFPASGSLYPALGGSGGDGRSGLIDVAGPNPNGGGGGSAFVISAAQRITVNGTIGAMGLSATQTETPGAQAGAGGSVRLSALLVEGTGMILTNGGNDSDGVVRTPSGPVEIQAFVQDFFSGTTVITPIRGNAPVQPIPANLPVISIDQVNTESPIFEEFGFANTGSLTTPDVTLPVPPTAQLDVEVGLSTELVPNGTVLDVRAVGADGSSFSTIAIVSDAFAYAFLTLNAGTTYQITAVPSTAFPSQRDPGGTATARGDQAEKMALPHAPVAARQWMKAFGLGTEQALHRAQTSPPAQN